ncbi:uncharacterized protein A1O5_02607 [Cladophialophora psammophila CBS 110553]|uniref:Fumarylacetoacetase-like C-terminal domain-containing protein n=1 Tax=Cladophialophora psammophila CBS 110553 TaxID=1182543 RepID=W9XBK4_9EURO|nr:uncharacterized protein A1O5_02607 [Cladophialophora psammophila CBS 110553]EXJ74311.1 hypothetical protein A1O5_02607 [Cladophialophora psammophila CBS 110553]
MTTTRNVPWDRLIRFVSAEDDAIYYGDAVVPDEDFDIGLPQNLSSLTAKIIVGSPLTADCVITDKIVKVKTLLGPLTYRQIPSVQCIGGNYLSHLRELNIEPPRYPAMFSKTSGAVAGYGDEVEIPKFIQDEQTDYEGELAFVIAKDAKNAKKEEALEYVLGYTSSNDVSARKWQMDPDLVGTFPPPQMTYGKSFDGFVPLGPGIVSTNVIKDPHTLSLLTKVNGEVRQQSNTSELHFNIPAIIEFLSKGHTLHAGTVVLTGTPGGVGFASRPPKFLKDGDKVEVYFSKIGTLMHGIKYE